MAHAIEKTFQSRWNEVTLICTCGWKEKARSKGELVERFKRHAKMPHRSLMQVREKF